MGAYIFVFSANISDLDPTIRHNDKSFLIYSVLFKVALTAHCFEVRKVHGYGWVRDVLRCKFYPVMNDLGRSISSSG